MAVDNNIPLESESAVELKTPEKSKPDTPSISPTTSRYGRTRKPKLSIDFVSTDKNLINFLTPSVNSETTLTNGIEQSSAVASKQGNSMKKELPSSEGECEAPCLNGVSSRENNTKHKNADIRDFFGKCLLDKGLAPAGTDSTASTPATPLESSSTKITSSQGKLGRRGRKKKLQISTPDKILENMNAVLSESLDKSLPARPDDSTSIETPNSVVKAKVGRPRGRPSSSLKNVPTPISSGSNTQHSINDSSATVNTASPTPGSTESMDTPASTGVISSVNGASSNLLTPRQETPGLPLRHWSVGDVVWGSVGRYPFWPCIIMTDPASNTHFQEKGNVKKKKEFFAQFCGDNGRHSWLSSINLMEFISKQEFLNLKAKIMQEKSKRTLLGPKFLVRTQLENWERAVSEAEFLLSLTRDERIKHFQRLYPLQELRRTKKDILALLFAEEGDTSGGEPSNASNSEEPASIATKISPITQFGLVHDRITQKYSDLQSSLNW